MSEVKNNINALNIYEVNVRQYTEEGTFNAFAKHLPRLKNMGVKILWLMPITPISLQEAPGNIGQLLCLQRLHFHQS